MLQDFISWTLWLSFLAALSLIVPGSSPLFSSFESAPVVAKSTEDSVDTVVSGSTFQATLINVLLGVFGGLYVGFGNMMFENAAYRFFEYLGRIKFIRRLAPSIPVTQHSYSMQSFIAVSLPYMLVFYGVAVYREGFIARAVWDLNPLKIYAFLWCVMTLHDFWFFLAHTVMHASRPLYHRLHALHHASRGDLTVFGTVLGEVPEIMLIFGVYYVGLFTYLYNQPTWNPAAFFGLIAAVNWTNCIGHCGYDLPDWFGGLLSVGYLFTPGHATSKSHYIHHLNVTVNRALYLKWHDYIWGSYRNSHPLIPEDTVAIPRCPSGMHVMPVEEDEQSALTEQRVMAHVESFGSRKANLVRQLSQDQRVRHMQRSMSKNGSVSQQMARSASGLLRQASGLVRQASQSGLVRQASGLVQLASVAASDVAILARRRGSGDGSAWFQRRSSVSEAAINASDAPLRARRASMDSGSVPAVSSCARCLSMRATGSCCGVPHVSIAEQRRVTALQPCLSS